MKKFLRTVLILVVVFGVSGNVNADLIVRGTDSLGNQLIYDTDLDITWYDYAKSIDTWSNQMAWADGLSISYAGGTIDDWRLPTTVDGIYEFGWDGTTIGGYNVTSSEMGHLFYEELGNLGRLDTSGNSQSGFGLKNTGDFNNLVESWYWSGTDYWWDPSNAWLLDMTEGFQSYSWQINNGYGLAVMDGDVPSVPIPSAILLLGSGLLGLVGIRRVNK